MLKAKKFFWSSAALGVGFFMLCSGANASQLDEQRIRYAEIKQAWDNKQMDTVASMMPSLRDYPLYPYLEYRKLTDGLRTESAAQVSQFIATYPKLPVSRTLTSRFVNELARRQDWAGLLSFSPNPPATTEGKCHYYFAQFNLGQAQQAQAGAESLWLTGRNLPNSCDRLFNAWRSDQGISPALYQQRLLLAIKQGNTSLVNALAARLPTSDSQLGKALVTLQNNPDTLLDFASQMPVTDLTREAVSSAFSQIARQDADKARAMIPAITQAQNLNEQQVQALKETVVWRLMGSYLTAAQAKWRDSVIMHSTSTTLLERRVRMALATGDRRGLNTWLSRLPLEAKEKDEWRYWQASLLLDRGRDREGKEILHALMLQRGFYPMVAAQKLDEPYHLSINKAGKVDEKIVASQEMARVRELMYWKLDNIARSEWAALVGNYPEDQQEGLARYAFENDWWDLSVQATIIAKLWDHLEERFPLAYQADFARHVADKSISESFAMAIARQESAWNPKAVSPVGASGLMQVMPATATHTAKMFGIGDYKNRSQLFEPEMNINIGTAYLQHVFRQFGDNRIFAAGAYNAGPGRMKQWLANSQGKIDAVAFIESIPFSETRGYVKNVLAYDAYYRYFFGEPNPIMTDGEWQRSY